MPCLFSHTYFGQLAARSMPESMATPDYYLGCAGPDPYFYDAFPPTPLRRPRLDLGRRLHHTPGETLFAAALRDCPPEELPFWAGMLCHLCLDAAAHPYVYARQGEIGHTQMEVVIDMQLYDAHGQEIGPMLAAQEGANLPLIDGGMTRVVKKLTGENTWGVYRRAAKKFFAVHRLSFDPTGRKRRLLTACERPLGMRRGLSGFLYTVGLGDKQDMRNEAHAPWAPFGQGEPRRRESFAELFDQGLSLCEKCMPLLLRGDAWELGRLLGGLTMG